MHRLWLMAGALTGLAALLIGAAIAYTRAESKPEPLPQQTPDAAIDSVFMLVDQGKPGRIAELIAAPNDDVRVVVQRIGALLDGLHALSVAMQERFPAEVETLRADAARGRSGGGLGALLRRPDPGQSSSEALRLLLADPYAALRAGRERVSTVMIADDAAAVLVDGRPAFGVGMTMRFEDDRWWFELPLNVPIARRFMPQTPEEFMILASMIHVIENAVLDLTDDVRRGRAGSVEDASRLAGEKAFGPMMICIVAYNRAMEARAQAGR